MSESDQYKPIILTLEANGFKAWRQNTGGIKLPGRFIHLAPKGTGDVIGFCRKCALFVGIEAKAPDDKTPEHRKKTQAAWAKDIIDAGGLYALAPTLEQVDAMCKQHNLERHTDMKTVDRNELQQMKGK